MAYRPKPLDTSNIALPQQLSGLVEALSVNTHDLWARRRLTEGWTLGPCRDDRLKKHPNLVPYDRLPEVNKDYDRMVVSEVLKAILKLGYTIGSNVRQPPGRRAVTRTGRRRPETGRQP